MQEANLNLPAISDDTLTFLKGWIGRTESMEDSISPAPLRALNATLDREDSFPKLGDVLPPLWHWLYFLPHHRQSEIGPDGHAQRGGFLPPVPLPRRMWAGGRLRWHSPLRVGDIVTRSSTVKSVTHKFGKTGDLLFVVVNHEIRNSSGICLTEEQDIVYRGATQQRGEISNPSVERITPNWERHITPDEVLLFRYSAMTFNGHRIHYDRAYATEVEGYPGLVVHGPLQATLLVDLVRRNSTNQLASFEFKALRPAFECQDQRTMHLSALLDSSGKQIRLMSRDHEGYLTMQAIAELV